MENLYYYNLCREVPETAQKRIQGGRMSGMTDINPMWRIKKLTEIFGPCGIGWYYKTVREWLEPYQETIAAFVKIELYIKVDGEWSMPIQGTGGSMFVEIQRSGPHVSDECYKMATTDAISVACKQLGIGADVYWDKDSTKYNNSSNRESSDTNNGVSQDQVKNEDEKKKIQEKRTEIEELCKKYNYTPEAICKSNNYIWEELLDETRLTNMLYSLKQGFGEE
ncbi:MAG: hypothetical protein HFG39_16105 [Lachnospiraceae bacterium]|nr:hypothetical protein [Lachnospiraceae bacterium]